MGAFLYCGGGFQPRPSFKLTEIGGKIKGRNPELTPAVQRCLGFIFNQGKRNKLATLKIGEKGNSWGDGVIQLNQNDKGDAPGRVKETKGRAEGVEALGRENPAAEE